MRGRSRRAHGTETEPHHVVRTVPFVADLVQQLLHHPQTPPALGLVPRERGGRDLKARPRVVDRRLQAAGAGHDLHRQGPTVFAVAVLLVIDLRTLRLVLSALVPLLVGMSLLQGLLFLTGQLAAWRELAAAGQTLSGNPANAFFYLLTALHGIHLLGGVWVWARSLVRVFGGASAASVRLSVELCTVYWHYLLLVWLVLFGLLLST